MSGHSKWSSIKHKKGAADKKRGQLFSKLSRALSVAAREGGPDPAANLALQNAIEKARSYSMPKDNIDRAIARGSGADADAEAFEQVLYEGYGPNGVAVIVEALTDNRNRTAADVRAAFSKYDGNLGGSGAVAWLFERRAVTPAEPAEVRPLPRRRSPAVAAIRALRPRQWSKNLLVFAGIVFAAKLGDAVRWGEAIAVFVAYCALSSAAYLVNDLRDREHDRRHPVKRFRPIAHGDLSARAAVTMAVVLTVVAVAIAAWLGWSSLALLLGFGALQLGYSFGLKHIVIVDVLVIGALFVIRAAAGAEAVDVRISPWLLLCTALLALFLALAKRRGELVLVGARETPGRPVLEGYSLELVDQLVTVGAASTVIAYSLYTFTARDSKALMVTIPFVVFGVFRYLLLVHRDDLGEEPEHVLLSDVPILAAVCLWIATAALILALT